MELCPRTSGTLVMSTHLCMLGQSFHAAYVNCAEPFNRSTFRVFKIERKMFGREDLDFLERVFQKLLLNFTW
jgi:hypothetical protein